MEERELEVLNFTDYEMSDRKNFNEKDLLYSQTPKFKKKRKDTILKALGYSILYLILLNILGVLVSFVVPKHLLGLAMSVTVILSALGFGTLFEFSKKEAITRKKKDFKFKDFLFFYGLMNALTIITSLLIRLVMTETGISSVNVTAEISSNLSWNMFLYVVLIGPFIEEYIYRGLLLKYLEKYGARLTIVLTGICFAFMHMNFIQSFGTLPMGLILSYVAYFYSFKAAFILHLVNNLYVMIVAQIPEESAAIFIISIMIIGLIIYSTIKLLSKERRLEFKVNLGSKKINPYLHAFEAGSLKALLTNWVFIVYLIGIGFLSIWLGSL